MHLDFNKQHLREISVCRAWIILSLFSYENMGKTKSGMLAARIVTSGSNLIDNLNFIIVLELYSLINHDNTLFHHLQQNTKIRNKIMKPFLALSYCISQPANKFYFANNFIMKVNRERNPYLKRIFSEQPHKYSYDIQSGKYSLIDQQGKTMNINPNGTFRPKFRPNYSGFVDHKSRYNDAHSDPAVLHFAPDPSPKTNYHNPMPDKFAGYAQYPYKLKKQFPVYLKKPNQPAQYPRKKALSLILGKEQKRSHDTSILQYSTARVNPGDNQAYFNVAWESMTQTKPLPKQKKKTCYNYRCKFMKQWVFDERNRLESSKINSKVIDNTLGRSFHQGTLQREMQQTKLLSTMALSGMVG